MFVRPSGSTSLRSTFIAVKKRIQNFPFDRGNNPDESMSTTVIVPKGRFELPHPCGYSDLNAACLPFHHFGLSCFQCLRTRPAFAGRPAHAGRTPMSLRTLALEASASTNSATSANSIVLPSHYQWLYCFIADSTGHAPGFHS
jgi:hypothetical protein